MPTTTARRSSGSGKVTINHDEIRRWVEQRGGRPACVKGTERGESCLLRIDYPGFSGEDTLEPIDWDEFFQTFDENNLAFVYQDSKNGKPSRFSKLVDRGTVKGQRGGSRGNSGRSNRGGGRGKSGRGGGSRSGGRATSGKSTTRRASSGNARGSSSRGGSRKSSSSPRSGGRSARATASRR